MKICHILAGNEEGGLENHVVTLCNALVKDNDISVIAHEKYRDRFDGKVHFYALDLSKGRKNPLLLLRLWRTIKHIDPDIVHAHANKAAAMIATLCRFLPQEIKRVATLHSQKKNLSSFETFDHVIGVSHEVIKEIQNPNKSVVYNGIEWHDREKKRGYIATHFGMSDQVFTLCSVGRLETVKNFSLLISSIQNLDVKLLLVGTGSCESKLKGLVQQLGIEDKVIFTGYREDAVEIIEDADLLVISSDKEGFPYVLVEALLAKTPVVSTDVSDVKTVLPEFSVVPVGDQKKLEQAISYVQSHYETVLESYQNTFAFAKTHFTLEAMVAGTQKVYDEVGVS